MPGATSEAEAQAEVPQGVGAKEGEHGDTENEATHALLLVENL